MTNILRKGQFYSVAANLVGDQDIKAKHLISLFSSTQKPFPCVFSVQRFHIKLTCFFWQITGVNVTYFIHGQDLGLVALMDTNGDLYYYEFDAQG